MVSLAGGGPDGFLCVLSGGWKLFYGIHAGGNLSDIALSI